MTTARGQGRLPLPSKAATQRTQPQPTRTPDKPAIAMKRPRRAFIANNATLRETLAAAAQCHRLTATNHRVLEVIVLHICGWSIPDDVVSHEQIAQAAGCSTKSVQRAVATLVAEGIIGYAPGSFPGGASRFWLPLSGTLDGGQLMSTVKSDHRTTSGSRAGQPAKNSGRLLSTSQGPPSRTKASPDCETCRGTGQALRDDQNITDPCTCTLG